MAVAQEIVVGGIMLRVINLGDLKYALKEVISVPESVWRPRYGERFERRISFPSQSVLVSTGNGSILVDAGEYSKFAAEASEYVEEGYIPPPGLVEQLAAMNVRAEDVSHVVITHAHYDHYAGVTTDMGGETVATFPAARYHLGQGDWDWQGLHDPLLDPSSNESKTLGALHSRGVLELVSKKKELAPGVTILPAPGESPGHQILKVQSEGHTAYCVGDLFHDPVEVENPGWMAGWCDPGTNLESRRKVIESALLEKAVVVPAHVRPGHIVKSGGGVTYAVDL